MLLPWPPGSHGSMANDIQPWDQEILASAREPLKSPPVQKGAAWLPREEEAYNELPKLGRQRGAESHTFLTREENARLTHSYLCATRQAPVEALCKAMPKCINREV